MQKLMESKGIAKAVNRKSLKKEDLIDAVMEVLNNSSYRQAITQLRELALDVPMTGLEKAIWWVEYVLRNKGAKHLRNPAADVPLYQYYLLDVIGLFMLLAGIYVTISYFVFKTIVNKIAVKLRKNLKKNVTELGTFIRNIS
ncbi:hypothetical protein NQ318_021897 [Aromia moschata]|uniref:UDP-glycosyltransferase n=1 Tax=Aromia moschata TaxID=1265417 RepID=A0AAV8Z883_9CUCU|nr:hypothetical protein NQ318_021897 [Aromia moschata]